MMDHIEFHNGVIKAIDFISQDLINFQLSPCQNLAYTPGQYIVIKWDQNTMRSYSIGSCDKAIWSFYVRLSSGRGSTFLRRLQPNNTVTFFGPTGDFFFKGAHRQHGRSIIATTGTGISPVLAWAEQLSAFVSKQNNASPVYIIQSAGCQEQLIKHDLLLEMSAKHALINYISLVDYKIFNNRPLPFNLGSEEKVDISLLLEAIRPDDKDTLYLCGNPNMVNSLVQKYGNTCEVITEAFG